MDPESGSAFVERLGRRGKRGRMAHPGGRPRALESPDQAAERAEAYFRLCDAEKRPYRICGLCLALGLSCRKQIAEYEAREEFTQVIKRLRLIVEDSYEERLSSTSPTGAIFALKNMEWTDQQQHTLSNPDGSGLFAKMEIAFLGQDRKS
jgi:hypothetical protein